MKTLLISLCVFTMFAYSCDPSKTSTTLLLDDGCLGMGFRDEVKATGIVKCELVGGPELYWDGIDGEWVEVYDRNGKEYQTFLLRFCPEIDLTDDMYIPLQPGIR